MKRIAAHPVLSVPNDKKPVSFLFNGQVMQGFEGEVVSSALFANGVQEFSIHSRDNAPQGIFCANGQCAQCTLIIDGFPLKSCITSLKEAMDIRTLKHLPDLPADDAPLSNHQKLERKCDVLVMGGGPSGLTATIELANLGFSVILVDDKEKLGGKLLLQTHKFFGSIEDCYAGTRGIDIAALLEKEVRALPNVEVFTNAILVGIYKDQKAGVFLDNRNYMLVDFKGLIISAGARERSLVFEGNDLVGVYGAGAFQTLVNRDLVKAAQRVFIVGSGNVGLIAAYHALQAGIQVAGIVDILDRVSGYQVHADKIQRMGVPIYLRHTVLCAEGEDRVQQVTITEVDENFAPLLETATTFEVDTLLIAAGLSPVDEYFNQAKEFGFKVVKAGDAEEIAEASSAMFGGRLAGLKLAALLGKNVTLDKTYQEKAQILKSRPGKIHPKENVTLSEEFRPVFHCTQEIPCDPCTSVCSSNAVKLRQDHGNILDLPYLAGECNGCGMCVAVCPGLAVTLARTVENEKAEVVLPHEFVPTFEKGDAIALVDQQGEFLERGIVLKKTLYKKYKTWLVRVQISAKNAPLVAGIQIQDPAVTRPLPEASLKYLPGNGIVCRCERVSLGEIVDYIREHNITDVNQLKQIRVGMGACGSKTCSVLLPRVFQMAGVDWKQVTKGTVRPLCVEVPMFALINEKRG
ncbi:MAG: FAD-dependent oxidoreductase [Pseudomonadota bacterium]